MKKLIIATSLFGGISLLAGATSLLSSFVTYHPGVQGAANRFMSITVTIWLVSLLITLAISLTAVPLALEHELVAARSVRRRGLWYSLPQIAVILFLVIGGLLLARDIASMGGH